MQENYYEFDAATGIAISRKGQRPDVAPAGVAYLDNLTFAQLLSKSKLDRWKKRKEILKSYGENSSS